MISLNVQNNKYTPGPLPEICAPRNDLLSLIDRAAEKGLVILSAPAGSGKTVSAQLWMRNSKRKIVWISLDAFDNTVSVFYRMFCSGILSAQPDNERMAAILQDPAFASSPVEHTIKLLSWFNMNNNKYVLALDDFHSITNYEILKSLPYIQRRMPHSFVTFIMSRNEPRKQLMEFMEIGQVAIICSEDMSFSRSEIKDYLRSHGHKGTTDEVEAAFNFTGGWAIGINAIACSNMPALQGFGGYDLNDYIERHMWDGWDESLRSFFTASAALDEMPVSLCEKITKRADAGKLLEHLMTLNNFVTRVEDDTYRYHHLFLDFLRTRQEYNNADKTKSWRYAAEHYSNEESHFIARKYAIESGYIKSILDVQYRFMRNSGHSIDEYVDIMQGFLFTSQMEKLCEECPVLCIPVAYAAFLIGDSRTFESNVDKVRQYLPLIVLKYSRFTHGAFSLVTLDYRTPFEKQISQAAMLPSIVFKDDEIRSATLSFQMPFLHRSCRDFYELTDKRMHSKFKKVYGKLLKKHYALATGAIITGVLLEQNNINAALNEALTVNSGMADWTVKEMRFAAYMHLAAVYLALDKKTLLNEVLIRTSEFVNSDAQFLNPNFLAFTTRIKLWDGNTDAAREWLDNYFVTEALVLMPYRIFQYFTTIRAYTVLGELDKAKNLAIRLRQMGKDFHRPQDSAEAGVLLAVILWADRRKNEAQEMMETVLQEMQPHSFIRMVADEGAAVMQVLKKVLGKTEHTDYQGMLDPVYVNSVYITAYAVSKQRKGIITETEKKPVRLSKQQKAIIRLLAQGHKRESIAEQTGISLNTVKYHSKLAYEKLGANNAAEAVMKARELGLI